MTTDPTPAPVDTLPAVLAHEERIALFLIGTLALADMLTPGMLYGPGNSIETLMRQIAAGIREAAVQIGPGAMAEIAS